MAELGLDNVTLLPSVPAAEMPALLAAADVCLVPQLYNARRFDVPIDDFPTLLRAEENANSLDAFAAAHPDRQEVPA